MLSCCSATFQTTTKKEAEDQTEKSFHHLEQLFSTRSHVVDNLKEVAKVLRGLPVVRHDIPTLCLVGAPNVGKSSLVRAISSGKPEVCNYPFTTRGISMGHFFVNTRRHQVTDTPGLLARPDNERNNIELLTIAALSFLPTSVLFVHDLTEECGTSIEDQYRLYTELKRRFGDKPWIDAVSKSDVLRQQQRNDDDPVSDCGPRVATGDLEVYQRRGPAGAIFVSAETGEGMEQLVSNVVSLLAKVESVEDGDLEAEAIDEQQISELWEARLTKTKNEDYYYPAFPSRD